MSAGINLINLEVRKSIQFTALKKKVNQVVFSILVLFIIFSIAILGMFFYLSGELKKNEAQAKLLRNQIKALEQQESYATVVADRVKLIKAVTEKRQTYLAFLNDLETLLVPGLKVESLDLSAQAIKLAGNCASNQVLTDLNSKMEILKKDDKYSSISFQEASRLQGGSYEIVLELKK